MSLDVMLYKRNTCPHCHGEIDGETLLYGDNITHNLNRMAEAAGIYMHLWRPDELNISTAKELIIPLTEGLKRLENHREEYEALDSPNGWGKYIHFLPFVKNYLQACIEHPEARVEVSR